MRLLAAVTSTHPPTPWRGAVVSSTLGGAQLQGWVWHAEPNHGSIVSHD